MDFELSDDQVALQTAAADLLAGQATPARVRAANGFDRQLWAAMAEQGWPGVERAADAGGLGLGMVEAAVLLEQAGRHVAPVPLLPTLVALDVLPEAWVARVLSGDAVVCVAWSSTPGAVAAVRDGEAWRLTGHPDPVSYAPVADVAVVPALVDDGDPALFAVEVADAVRPAAEPAMDVTSIVGWLDLEGTPARRLGGADAVDRLLDRAAAAYSAELLGAADKALEMSVEHAKQRVQFGRPIGSFQAVKHRCADMLVDVEGMRSTAYWAAWCLSVDHADASVAASTAKIWCADAGRRVLASALQVHGGIGFTWEHDLHLYLKRAQFDQVAFGDASIHRERLAHLLRARLEAGETLL